MAENDVAQLEGETATVIKEEVREPKDYRVLMHNDDYTHMDFVEMILQRVFHKSPQEAHKLMMTVHTCGRAQCGIYTLEIAKAKVNTVHASAREAGFPLTCSLEEI